MKKLFGNPKTKSRTLKIFSMAFSAVMALQTACTPAHAGWNTLMSKLENANYMTVDDIKDIVERDPSCVKESFGKRTALDYAVSSGKNTKKNRIALIKYLMQKGARPNRITYSWACKNNEYEFASWLLTQKFMFCSTTAYCAIIYDLVSDLKYILEQAPRLLCKDLMWYVVTNGSPDCAKYLINEIGLGKLGINEDNIELYINQARDNSHNDIADMLTNSPVYKAKIRAKQLAERAEARAKAEAKAKEDYRTTGNTALHNAVIANDEPKVRRLLTAKKNPNTGNKNGETPLHLAVKNGNVDMIKLLTYRGANPNIADANGNTPLHLAAEYGNDRLISLLVEKRANINAKNNEGQTPLHLAATAEYSEDKDPITRLISHGALIDVHDNKGYTPLCWAVRENQFENVKNLIRHGANPHVVTADGYTLLDIHTRYTHNDEMKKMLEDLGITHNHGTVTKAFHKFVKFVRS